MVSAAGVDQGEAMLRGPESEEEALRLAFSLETAQERFYAVLAGQTGRQGLAELFRSLARCENAHAERVWNRYRALHPETERSRFEREAPPGALESGLSPDEQLQRSDLDFDSPEDALDFALALEADALDLYLRLRRKAEREETRAVFQSLAEEERAHLRRLGEMRG